MRIILCGFGVVGQSFAKLLESRSEDLYARYGLKPRIVGVFDRNGSAIDPSGLDINRFVDVKKNMITLPLIHSYSTLNKSESRQVKKILNLKRKSQKEINILTELVDASGGFEYANQKIDEFSNQAIDILGEYPDSLYKQSLTDLVIFNSHRNY